MFALRGGRRLLGKLSSSWQVLPASFCPCPWISHRTSIQLQNAANHCWLRAAARSSSSGVFVLSCSAWMPPSLAISSFIKPYTIRCRAGCIFPLKASDTIFTLVMVSVGQCWWYVVAHTESVSVTISSWDSGGVDCYSTSLEVLPCMALWCAWRCESLCTSSLAGFRVSVICRGSR